MTTATAYTIEYDAEAELWLVLDENGDHIDDGPTEKAARKAMARRVAEERHEALRQQIEERLWDASLETLEKIRALLGA